MKLSVDERLKVLNRIYQIYEEVSDYALNACSEGCSSCCTRNVTMTGLEGLNILNNIPVELENGILSRIRDDIDLKRDIPQTTVNRMAVLCAEGRQIPEEESDPLWGECPLLEDDRCIIYEKRPFACRCMVSKVKCDNTGFADMDDYMITLNNVFMQYIEHIDQGGHYGNLSDLVPVVSGNNFKSNLLVNSPVKVLMVPPEHRDRISMVMEKLQRL